MLHHTAAGAPASRHFYSTAQDGAARPAQDRVASPAVEPVIHHVFEKQTGTWQYLVADPATQNAVIIDPVLDYDATTRTISSQTADSMLSLVQESGYHIAMILETHAHADHLTAAAYLQARLAALQGDQSRPPIAIGKRIVDVQKQVGATYGVPTAEYEGAFDKLFDDDDVFMVGDLSVAVMHLPGHTPDHIGYKIADNVFCGDSLFQADLGSARCDFPGGSATLLYNSARRRLLDVLPGDVKVWTGHGFRSSSAPEDAKPMPYTTIRDHRAQNKHLKDGVSESEFVAQRRERDTGLPEPRLIHESLQWNIRAGRLPEPSGGAGNRGKYRMLSLPLKLGKDVEPW
ncbi:putative metallo-beta-lactamase domain protein [Coniochaeta ligniaria NRRL 30616]|uniref:Putative metallo-beta-lactamase domain protein n=1 Tax=Coniochaeta ligniaria NRRL 30616 TaxID=1408157 RepID=A0A1J7J586_9PEZI|nr:putative metallo-beta-lactamase domain protein [Coniochaeta ligniaria NRRL 30616]